MQKTQSSPSLFRICLIGKVVLQVAGIKRFQHGGLVEVAVGRIPKHTSPRSRANCQYAAIATHTASHLEPDVSTAGSAGTPGRSDCTCGQRVTRLHAAAAPYEERSGHSHATHLHLQRLGDPQEGDDACAVLRAPYHLRVYVRVQRAAVRLHDGVGLQLLAASTLFVSSLLHTDEVPAAKQIKQRAGASARCNAMRALHQVDALLQVALHLQQLSAVRCLRCCDELRADILQLLLVSARRSTYAHFGLNFQKGVGAWRTFEAAAAVAPATRLPAIQLQP
jgi:hypothetical protein